MVTSAFGARLATSIATSCTVYRSSDNHLWLAININPVGSSDPGYMHDVDVRNNIFCGLAGSHIHTEQFTSLAAITPGVVATARPAPHAPVKPGNGPLVTFARAGLTAAFDEACASLLEMAEACDVPTRWSCRTGVCHTCATPLLSGAVDYSPPPLFEPDPGEVLLCCAQPRVDVVLDL